MNRAGTEWPLSAAVWLPAIAGAGGQQVACLVVQCCACSERWARAVVRVLLRTWCNPRGPCAQCTAHGMQGDHVMHGNTMSAACGSVTRRTRCTGRAGRTRRGSWWACAIALMPLLSSLRVSEQWMPYALGVDAAVYSKQHAVAASVLLTRTVTL